MEKRLDDGDTIRKLLEIVEDLLRGVRHSRRTIAAKSGKSPGTADRWITEIQSRLPNVRKVREGKTTWLTMDRTAPPSRSAAIGACVAASLAALFAGTEHERNLKDARDAILRQRGEAHPNLDRKFVFAPRGGEYALPEKGGDLDEIVEALLRNKILQFSYTHNDGTLTQPRVEPMSLVVFEHQFYVLARKADRSLYCYRFARMSNVEAQGETFEYPTKNEYDPRSVLEGGFGIHISSAGPIEEVAVQLSGAWASYARTHRWHPTQQVQQNEDGSVTVALRVRLCREVETWVLGFGEHALVLRPESLRKTTTERLRNAVANYSAASAPRPSLAKAHESVNPSSTRAKR